MRSRAARLALLLSACGGAIILGQQDPGQFTISGRVVDPLRLRPQGLSLTLGRYSDYGSSSFGAVRLESDGSFATERLPAGRYVLRIVRDTGGPEDPILGFKTVTVTTAYVTDVSVAVRRDTSLTGRFRMVSDNPAAKWPPSIIVNTWFAFEGMGPWPAGGAEGAPGGKFVLTNAFGPRVLRCGYTLAGGSRWWPDRVLLDGKDVTNVPIDFSEHEKANLEVLFTQHPSRITGTVVRGDGTPVRGAFVLVAAADPALRQLWATTSESVQTDPDGSFQIVTLPGRYVVQTFAPNTASSHRNAWRLFPRLGAAAVPVQLGDREQKTIRLTLVE